jgi:uncharacterized protein (TIGR03083 family)
MSSDDALTALRQEILALSAVLYELDPAQFSRPTNCPPWNLRELIVHMAASVAIRGPFLTADSQSILASAADYYRRPERDTSAYRQRNVDRTQQLARTVAAPGAWFDQISRDAVARLGEDDLERAVLIPGRDPMRLADWVVTRVISIAAHSLDVAITLDRQPWTTEAALTIIRPVFVDLLGVEPPTSLGWDGLALLETATGRRTLTDRERVLLGPRHERFPLLS